MSPKCMQILNTFHMKSSKRIQGLPYNTANVASLPQLGWLGLSAMIAKARLMYIYHVLNLSNTSVARSLFVSRF